jgi:predicted RNase H-like HicB family nuclease/post-segregation antitoxin (ccd killing protein)
MRLVSYSAVFDDTLNEPGHYTVTFPDVPGAITDGDSFAAAIFNAQTALGLMLYDQTTLPAVTAQRDIEAANPGKLVTTVAVDLEAAQTQVQVVSVKKNTRIPADIAKQAEAQGINFSAVLTAALKQKLEQEH